MTAMTNTMWNQWVCVQLQGRLQGRAHFPGSVIPSKMPWGTTV